MSASDLPSHVVAIDGPSASGKSSTARDVAERLGFVHLNSGLLYRAVAWTALRDGWIDAPDFGARVENIELDLTPDPPSYRLRVNGERPGRWLHSAEVSRRASQVAERQAVRDHVNAALRAAAHGAGLVVDGRDIGTEVFPEAFLKIFLVASPEERARRRLADDEKAPDAEELAAEAERLRERDERDSRRVIAPLARAEDAIELDNTERNRGEVVEEIVRLYEAKRSEEDG